MPFEQNELTPNGAATVAEIMEAVEFAARSAEYDNVQKSVTKLVAALEYAEQQYRRFEHAHGTADCEALLQIRRALGLVP